jgi:hypothetical protein
MLPWHHPGSRWTVIVGSPEHADTKMILDGLAGKGVCPRQSQPSNLESPARRKSDEAWVIDLCDAVLGLKATRQHRFPFLLGDPSPSGRAVSLPVDAYYPELNLVIEYHERQHTEAVGFFDRRLTVSGVSRGEQRRRYDERRRALLPANGITLVIFSYSDFAHTRSGRLFRSAGDRNVVASRVKMSRDKRVCRSGLTKEDRS